MLHIWRYYMQIFSFQKGSQFLKATLMSNDVPLFSSFISFLIITTDARSLSLNKLAVFMIKLITFQQQPSLSFQILRQLCILNRLVSVSHTYSFSSFYSIRSYTFCYLIDMSFFCPILFFFFVIPSTWINLLFFTGALIIFL